MGSLKIHQELITEEVAAKLVKVCPFGAISENGGKLEISSACKMCKLCVRNGGGAVEFVEEELKSVDKSLWRGVCVYADCQGGTIHRVTYELCGKAKELASVTGHPVYALLIGYDIGGCARKLLHYGVDKVFVYDHQAFDGFRIEPYAAAFCDFIDKVKPSSILVGATDLGRQLAPRVAARCRAGLTADCTVLEMKENTDLVQIRPAFGGNLFATIVCPDHRPQMSTVRPGVMKKCDFDASRSAEVVHKEIAFAPQKIRLVEEVKVCSVVDSIEDAKILVACGRGVGNPTSIEQAKNLATELGGTYCSSRSLVDAGIIESCRQVGQTGKTVRPECYVAFGISGAVQHLAGMEDSDYIIAVNKDENASIFNVSDLGIVSDANKVLPLLREEIEKLSRA